MFPLWCVCHCPSPAAILLLEWFVRRAWILCRKCAASSTIWLGGPGRVPETAWFFYTGHPRSWGEWLRASALSWWRSRLIFVALLLPWVTPRSSIAIVFSLLVFIGGKFVFEGLLRRNYGAHWVERFRIAELIRLAAEERLVRDYYASRVVTVWVVVVAKIVAAFCVASYGPLLLFNFAMLLSCAGTLVFVAAYVHARWFTSDNLK